MLEPGAVIGGRFRVDRVLGAGGMGVVVAATHLELGQQVALKVMHDELATNPMIIARFLREAKAVAQLRTEHVCRVFDVGRLDSGAPFIVMEMLEGSDLGAVVVRGPVSMTIAVEYIIQACVALGEAHAAGLVHRDIKPPNLFVVRRPDGGPLVKVLDFGIAKAATAAEAKLTQTTSTMGSPGYMSPEQIRSTRDCDLRTDIWALGVTLYQLLSGRMPFHGTQLAEIAVAVMTAAPAPIEIDPTLRGILMRCLEKDPEKRFANVAELAVALMPFGGPSAPRYVRVITGGRVGGQEASGAMHPMMATGPQLAPLTPVPIGQMTAATGVNVGYPAPTGPAPMSYPQSSAYPPPPMPHGTSPQMAGGTSPHLGAPPRGKGKWVAIGIVLVVVLVGGGALAGFLARGTAKGEAAKDAGAVVVADAAPAATPIDAGEATVKRDPWKDGPPPSEGSAETAESAEEAEAAREQVRAAAKMAQESMGPYKDQALAGLRMAEKQIESYKNYGADTYEQLLAGYAGTACMLDDGALAKKFYARITKEESRELAEEQCEMYGHPMKPAAKAPKPGQKM